jgi:beta-lactamase superfamily II metal-dependent hydrolase
VVLFDTGEERKRKDCTKPVSYLDQLGIKQIDYLYISHYHFDHIGCVPDVLQQFPLQSNAFDRGEQYPGTTYDNYVAAVSDHRKTPQPGETIQLDADSGNPVTIKVIALNGAGVSTTNENDLSLTVTVSFGQFRAEIGGDLSGDNTAQYQDIETPVAPLVGHVDVYKVHHHCSSHSTNEAWLQATTPTVGIVSTGDGNAYGHPTADCLERLHKASVKTYWTETGAGADPEPGLDLVGGNIVVQVDPAARSFSVTSAGGQVQSFPITGSSSATPNPPTAAAVVPKAAALPKYAWSTKSQVYHYANCDYVRSISPSNLQQGSSPPEGKELHKKCPLVRQP